MERIAGIACVVATLFSGACATAPMTAAEADGRVICNSARMDQAERAAQRVGARMVWINCPRTTIRVPQPAEREIS